MLEAVEIGLAIVGGAAVFAMVALGVVYLALKAVAPLIDERDIHSKAYLP